MTFWKNWSIIFKVPIKKSNLSPSNQNEMQNKIWITLLLVMMASVLSAQRFEGGILGGFNGTQVEGDRYKGYNKPGLLLGAYVQTDLAPAVFAGMELKYSQKGARSRSPLKQNRIIGNDDGEIPVEPVSQKYIMRLGYAEMPIFVGFRTSEYISVVGGISLGYLMHAAEYDDYGRFPEEDEQAFNHLDIQPFVGFQYDLLDQLKLDLRLAYSVLPIRGKPVDSYYWISSQFNNVISMALYYEFGRGY